MWRTRKTTQGSLQKSRGEQGFLKRYRISSANLILDFKNWKVISCFCLRHFLWLSFSYLFFLNVCFFLVFTDWVHPTSSSNNDLPLSQLWSCSQFHYPQPFDYIEKGNLRHVAPGTIGGSQESRVILCKHGLQVSIIQQVCISGPCAVEKRDTDKVRAKPCSEIAFSAFVPGILLGTLPSLAH